VCTQCREEAPLTPEALIEVGVPADLVSTMRCYRGIGCSTCGGTGYKGRIALYEVMPMSEAIREAVLAGASSVEIKRAAIDSGMKTLRMSGIGKIAEGLTTVEEVLRITMPD
jgi:type IV pilus assembly protein PilB